MVWSQAAEPAVTLRELLGASGPGSCIASLAMCVRVCLDHTGRCIGMIARVEGLLPAAHGLRVPSGAVTGAPRPSRAGNGGCTSVDVGFRFDRTLACPELRVRRGSHGGGGGMGRRFGRAKVGSRKGGGGLCRWDRRLIGGASAQWVQDHDGSRSTRRPHGAESGRGAQFDSRVDPSHGDARRRSSPAGPVVQRQGPSALPIPARPRAEYQPEVDGLATIMTE